MSTERDLTKRKMAELIIKRLANGFPSDDFEIEDQEIFIMIEDTQDEIVTNSVAAAVRRGDFEYANMFTKTYMNVDSSADKIDLMNFWAHGDNPEGMAINYSAIPLKIEGLSPIHNITIGEDKSPVYPARGSQKRVKGLNTYRFDGQFIRFNLDDFDSFLATQFDIEFIPSAKLLAPDEPYQLVPEVERQIIQSIVDFYQPSANAPKDEESDGVKVIQQ